MACAMGGAGPAAQHGVAGETRVLSQPVCGSHFAVTQSSGGEIWNDSVADADAGGVAALLTMRDT